MDKKLSGGFAALVGIMIAAAVLIFLAAQQYQRLAERNHQVIPREEQLEDFDAESSTSSGSPIDRAESARDALEGRGRISY